MTLLDLDPERRARVETRLAADTTIWVTTVRGDGQPQASPVGFTWDGARFVILSQPGSPKVANLRANHRVALHLDIEQAADDGGILTLEGVAELDPSPLGEPERSAYLDKYREIMREAGFTPDEVFAEYSTVVRVTPTRVRSY